MSTKMPPDCAEKLTKNPMRHDELGCTKDDKSLKLLTGRVLLVEAGGCDSVDFTQRTALHQLLRGTIRIVI